MVEEEGYRAAQSGTSEEVDVEASTVMVVRTVQLPAQRIQQEKEWRRVSLVHLDGENGTAPVSAERSLPHDETHGVAELEVILQPRR
jgi:hypothetical protein